MAGRLTPNSVDSAHDVLIELGASAVHPSKELSCVCHAKARSIPRTNPQTNSNGLSASSEKPTSRPSTSSSVGSDGHAAEYDKQTQSQPQDNIHLKK